MRALLAVLMLCPVAAVADPSSDLDSLRLFNATEVYRLDPSEVRAELGYSSGQPRTDPTLEVRAEVGLTRHFQLNLAEDISAPSGKSLQPSATPISLRYTLGATEDDLLLNPAIEANVTPRLDGPARAGVRLLLSEELVPRLVVAANGYVEQNLNRGTAAGVDGAYGTTAGLSYALVRNHVRLGVEGQLGEAEYGLPAYYLVMAAGPNAVFSLGPVAATLTGMFDLTQRHLGFEPTVTLGCTF